MICYSFRTREIQEIEVSQDKWNLTICGNNSTVSFTVISQHWPQESIKLWTANDLPKRRFWPGRRTIHCPGGVPPRQLPDKAIGVAADA